MIATGMSLREIERVTQEKGKGIKRETLADHINRCLGGQKPASNPVALAKVANSAANSSLERVTPVERDLAKLVQRKVIEGIEAGDLAVTVKDGLAATAILDKRDARKEDQRFMIGLARLLSGAGVEGPIEGEAIDVTPANPLLAPASVIGDD